MKERLVLEFKPDQASVRWATLWHTSFARVLGAKGGVSSVLQRVERGTTK